MKTLEKRNRHNSNCKLVPCTCDPYTNILNRDIRYTLTILHGKCCVSGADMQDFDKACAELYHDAVMYGNEQYNRGYKAGRDNHIDEIDHSRGSL